MKVVFFGTPQFAVATLQKLLESRHDVIAVVSQPDKPVGRGRKLTSTPVKQLALEHNIPVYQPARVKKNPEFTEQLRALDADVAVVVAYGQILPGDMLTIPKHGFMNVHASLLPKYRGAAPIQWAIANGETETGVTIMQIDEGLDSGDILAHRHVDILEDDDARSLHDILSFSGAELMIDVLDHLEECGHTHGHPQDHDAATYAPLIKREDAAIDWTRTTEQIIFTVRGFVIWPGAHTKLKGEEVKITAADAVDPSWISVKWDDELVPVGMVVETLKGRGIVVKTGSGLLLLKRLKFAGKKEMDAMSAVNGGLIDVGSQFE